MCNRAEEHVSVAVQRVVGESSDSRPQVDDRVHKNGGKGAAGAEGGASADRSARTNKAVLGLSIVLLVQIWGVFSFESSSAQLEHDLELGQRRVRQLTERLVGVERAAMACYTRLNSTEQEMARESEIINDETRTLHNLTARELAEEAELRSLRLSVQNLNASLIKSKITLRYEMEERLAAEKAAQGSQDSMQMLKDQLLAAQEENKALQERLHKNAAKAQKKLSRAEKKAKDESNARQRYMEDMISLQSKLGRTKSLLDDAALNAVNLKQQPASDDGDADEALPGLDSSQLLED